ncbi:MAG TPA: carboxypeptidase-like regulatory domain-containing protein [Burkholderiaceae bacterium]|nr:carboxypeptidase-like regulatory domain-containing protein [Burkholderiaceae bacterium]
MVTALHGVAGCASYTAHRDDRNVYLDDLQLALVDVDRDVAFFTSAKLDADRSAPLSMGATPAGAVLKTVGYPQATPSQLSYPVELHENARRRLDLLLHGSLLLKFQQRRSPDPARDILAVRSILQAGLSGAPIFTVSGRRVVAVVNGGLQGGWPQINWAIPLDDIDWKTKDEARARLQEIEGQSPGDLFASAQDEGGAAPVPQGLATLSGHVLYNGRPLAATVPRADVVIDLMETDSRRIVPADVRYDRQTGDFVIRGIAPGKYTPFVRAETGYPFHIESGGDYFSRISGMNPDIVVAPHDDSLRRDLEVIQVIHLTRPVDNQARRTYAQSGPEKLYPSFYAPSAELFVWDPVPGATSYEVTILLVQRRGDRPLDIKTFEVPGTSVRPGLSVTPPNTFYMFRISAYGPSRKLLGVYQNYYHDGSGGWFEFTVVPAPTR